MKLGFQVVAITLALAGTAPVLAAAPDAPVPSVGKRVRVDFMLGTQEGKVLTQRAATRIGVLRAVDSTSIQLEVSPSETHSITFGDLSRIEVSSGRTARQGMLRGAFYGAAIGLVLGAGFHAVTYDRLDPDRNQQGFAAVAGFSAGGLLVGGAAGRSMLAEDWRAVPVRSLWEHP